MHRGREDPMVQRLSVLNRFHEISLGSYTPFVGQPNQPKISAFLIS